MEKKRRSKRLFGAVGMAGGLTLLAFELFRFNNGAEGWFWMVVAVLMVLFGAAELFSKSPEEL
jgi:hypothetical protein